MAEEEMMERITVAENNRHAEAMELQREKHREKQEFHQAKLQAMTGQGKSAMLSAINDMARNIMDHEPGVLFETAFERAKRVVDAADR